MKRNNAFLAFLVIGIIGTLWHFVYDWSGRNSILGIFAPVSESTWEHLKLLLYPSIMYRVIEYIFIKDKPKNYIPATVFSIIAGMLSTVILFYTYTGIIGYNISFIDITIFFISLIIELIVFSWIMKRRLFSSGTANIIALVILVILIVLFSVWSFSPPSLGIFTPPITSKTATAMYSW